MRNSFEWKERVHPRARGEYFPIHSARMVLRGPSPRARGIRVEAERDAPAAGSIPARAGNTYIPPRLLGTARVHPRARGILYGNYSLMQRRGSIPARAGNTSQRHQRTPSTRVHPRARGEYVVVIFDCVPREGPSPRARGILYAGSRLGSFPGSIPARAGNTCESQDACDARPVHPRARGEYHRAESLSHREEGPSPRARGILKMWGAVGFTPGSIPARAGNTVKPRAR